MRRHDQARRAGGVIQQRLLVRRYPERGAPPAPPIIPSGPEILEGAGDTARSTYEARNLLETAHDDALFDYFTTSELVILDPVTLDTEVIGEPAPYTTASFSPDRGRTARLHSQQTFPWLRHPTRQWSSSRSMQW